MNGRVTCAEFLEAVRAAQYAVIKRWLLQKYIGDVAIIQPWTPFLYGISGFSARQVKCGIKSLGQVRLRLRRMAETHGIWVKQSGRHVVFLMDHEECNRMAEKAKLELIAEGYSETEKREMKL